MKNEERYDLKPQTHTQTQSEDLHQTKPFKTFIPRKFLFKWVYLRACVCVRAWVSVQAYFIWGTRNLIFKLAFCNGNLCGCRCSFLPPLPSLFLSICVLLSFCKRTLWFSVTPLLLFHIAWWIFVVQKPHQSELWFYISSSSSAWRTRTIWNKCVCVNVCICNAAKANRLSFSDTYLVHFVSKPSHLSRSVL